MRFPFALLLALAPAAAAAAASVSAEAGAEVLISADFNGPSPWLELLGDTSGPTVFAEADFRPVGSPTTAPDGAPSGALHVAIDSQGGGADWKAFVVSGPLPVKNSQTKLDRLKLAFALSASAARPLVVRIESFDTNRNRTGGLERRIAPIKADKFQHFALSLSDFRPSEGGAFDPAAPFVQFSWVVSAPDWPAGDAHWLRIDDVVYSVSSASPAP